MYWLAYIDKEILLLLLQINKILDCLIFFSINQKVMIYYQQAGFACHMKEITCLNELNTMYIKS